MKKWRDMPVLAAVPREGFVLTLAAAALFIISGLLEFIEPTNMGRLDELMFIAAGILLVMKKHTVLCYRWSCVLAALAFYVGDNNALAIAAALMLLSAFNLRSDRQLENVPSWMCRPLWSLIIAIYLACLLVDGLVFFIGHASMKVFVAMVPRVALLVLCLALEGRVLPPKAKQPRLQFFPGQGKLFDIAALLLVIYVIFDFFTGMKLEMGLPASALVQDVIAYSFGGGMLFFKAFIRLVPDVAAVVLLMGAATRREFFPLTVFLLMINRVGEPEGELAIWMVLVVMLVGAIGVTWNKPIPKIKLPVLSLIALLLAAALIFTTITSNVDLAKDEAANVREEIAEKVEEAAQKGAYKEATGKNPGSSGTVSAITAKQERVIEKAIEAGSKAAVDTVYDSAYEAAYEAAKALNTDRFKVTDGMAKAKGEEIAQQIADQYQEMGYGIGHEVYFEVFAAVMERESELFVAVNVLGEEEAPTYPDLKEKLYKELKKDYDQELVFSYYGNYSSAYEAAFAAVKGLAYEPAFNAVYEFINSEVYVPCAQAAQEAAQTELDSHEGEVYDAVVVYVMLAFVDLLLLVSLLLMCLNMELRAAKPVPSRFRAVLDWCYTNVGVKLQKCMKALGAVNLVSGALGAVVIALAVVVFFQADFMAALTLLGVGVALIIVSAMGIITTYPLFGFAQVAADIHELRGGVPAAPALPAEKAEEPREDIWEEAEATDENPDGLPEL